MAFACLRPIVRRQLTPDEHDPLFFSRQSIDSARREFSPIRLGPRRPLSGAPSHMRLQSPIPLRPSIQEAVRATASRSTSQVSAGSRDAPRQRQPRKARRSACTLPMRPQVRLRGGFLLPKHGLRDSEKRVNSTMAGAGYWTGGRRTAHPFFAS
jgi:hypothetical protein